MILAFGLRRVARCRQRKVLKDIVLPGPGRRRRFASIMTDRTLDNPDYPEVPNAATSRRFFVSLFALMSSSHPGQITPPFSVGAGRWRQEGEGGREVCWCQMPSPGRRRAWGEWPGKTKEKISMSTNVPALKKSSGVGGPERLKCAI
jgi:hypothetical protein